MWQQVFIIRIRYTRSVIVAGQIRDLFILPAQAVWLIKVRVESSLQEQEMKRQLSLTPKQDRNEVTFCPLWLFNLMLVVNAVKRCRDNVRDSERCREYWYYTWHVMFYEKAEEDLQRNFKTLYVELQKQHEHKREKNKDKDNWSTWKSSQDKDRQRSDRTGYLGTMRCERGTWTTKNM